MAKRKSKLVSILGAITFALSSLGIVTPAQASATCVPGYYLSPDNPEVCNSAYPGSFVSNANSLTATLCPPGTYQPYYNATSCFQANAGYASSDFGSTYQYKCYSGGFQANIGSEYCDSASPGKYVSSSGAIAETVCPPDTYGGADSNVERGGNSSPIDCFDFNGTTNIMVAPEASATYTQTIPFDMYLKDGKDPNNLDVKVTYTGTSSGSSNYEFHFSMGLYAYKYYTADFDTHIASEQIPLAWRTTAEVYGCPNVCNSEADRTVTQIPSGTYTISIQLVDSAPNTLVTTRTGIIIGPNQVGTEGYVFQPEGPPPYYTTSESLPVEIYVPMPYVPGSLQVIMQNAPLGMEDGSTVSRVITLSDNLEWYPMQIPVAASATTANDDSVLTDSSSSTGPGNWWAVAKYRRLGTTTDVKYTLARPYLVVRSCADGTYSPDGFSECVPVAAGNIENYPSTSSFASATKSFQQVACSAGTYRPAGSSNTCLSAPAGTYSNAGATEPIKCAIGTFQSSTGQSSCTSSSAGFYVATEGASAQTACPAGTMSSAGARAITDCIQLVCQVFVKKSASESCLLTAAGQTKPAKSKLTITVPKASKKICKASGSKVKVLKAGTCVATLTYKPKRGPKIIYRSTIVGS